jgi:thiol:disulfide interchange protein
MSGLFEVGTRLQSLGAVRVSGQRPRLEALLTGVLAVVVAAPCTAPFMATAIGVALSQGGLVSFVIFTALGVGFAAPFVVLSYAVTLSPSLARLMPRPGPWMDSFKKYLSVPMYGAVVWMVWVFYQQTGLGTLWLMGGLLILSLGLILKNLPKWIRPVLGLAALGLLGVGVAQPPVTVVPVVTNLAYERFSPGRIAQLRAQNKPVFVDLTAAWCVSCKVNERLVFQTLEFETAIKETGTVYMVGDWTHQDAEISRYLKQNNRSGVPLYVYYGPNQAAPVILPQLLNTKDTVRVLRGRQTQ